MIPDRGKEKDRRQDQEEGDGGKGAERTSRN